MSKKYYLHEDVWLLCSNGTLPRKLCAAEKQRPVKIRGYIQGNEIDRFPVFLCKYALIVAALVLGVLAALFATPVGWILLAAIIGIIIGLGMCAIFTFMSKWQNIVDNVIVYKNPALTDRSFIQCPVMSGIIKPFFSTGAAMTQLAIQDVFTAGEIVLAFVGGKSLGGMGLQFAFLNIVGNAVVGIVVGKLVIDPIGEQLGFKNMMDVGVEPEKNVVEELIEAQEALPKNKKLDSYSLIDKESYNEMTMSDEEIAKQSQKTGDQAVKENKGKINKEARKAGEEKRKEINKQREEQRRNKQWKTTRKEQTRQSNKAATEAREKMTKEVREKAQQTKKNELKTIKGKGWGKFIKSALKSIGSAIAVGMILGPLQDLISQTMGDWFAKEWEEEARKASGVAKEDG
jgi:hypothetical protein